MATRTKRTKADPKKLSQDESGNGPVYIDGVMHLSPLDLAQYDLAQTRTEKAVQAIQLKRSEIVQAQYEFDMKLRELQAHFEGRQRQLTTDLEQATNEAKARGTELRAIQDRIESTYNIKLNEVTYDDVSGRISVLTSTKKE